MSSRAGSELRLRGSDICSLNLLLCFLSELESPKAQPIIPSRFENEGKVAQTEEVTCPGHWQSPDSSPDSQPCVSPRLPPEALCAPGGTAAFLANSSIMRGWVFSSKKPIYRILESLANDLYSSHSNWSLARHSKVASCRTREALGWEFPKPNISGGRKTPRVPFFSSSSSHKALLCSQWEIFFLSSLATHGTPG